MVSYNIFYSVAREVWAHTYPEQEMCLGRPWAWKEKIHTLNGRCRLHLGRGGRHTGKQSTIKAAVNQAQGMVS